MSYVHPTATSSSSRNYNDLFVVSRTSSPNSFSDPNIRKRTAQDSFASPQKKKKKSKIIQDGNKSSSDTQSDEDEAVRLMDTTKTPTFRGRRLIHAVKNDSTLDKLVGIDSFSQQMETKYLLPLLVGQERLEKMIKSMYKNQIKIQKALNKRQVLF